MWRLGPCKVCNVFEFLWVPTGRRAKIQSGGSNTFSVPHLVRKLPRGHLRKAWKTTEFYNGFGYRQSFTGWVFVHYQHHKHPACIRSLWGLCWTGVYWIMVTFLEGCNSKLHFFFYKMKLIFLPTLNHTLKRGYLLSQSSYTCLGVCGWWAASDQTGLSSGDCRHGRKHNSHLLWFGLQNRVLKMKQSSSKVTTFQ